MSISRILSNIPSDLANSIGKLLSVDNSNKIVWVDNTSSANTIYLQGALDQANSDIVNANTQLKSYVDGQDNNILNYVSGVDNSQNTRISNTENNISYLHGALNQTNTDIVTANTQLKSYVDGYIISSNTQLKSYTDGAINSANTQLKSYTDGLVSQANTWLQANDASTLIASKSYTDSANTTAYNCMRQ